MAQKKTQQLAKFIEKFEPLKHISHKYHSQLSHQLRLITVTSGTTIVRKSSNPKHLHFLLKGSVELRESFDLRSMLDSSAAECARALENQSLAKCSIKALEDCQLLVANAEHIDQLLAWSQDYSIYYLDEGDLSVADDEMIDDDYQEDWENVFIRSNLATNLANTVIHQIMSQLEDISVNKGETIIKANSPGEYFYLIKEGSAVVQTADRGPFKGERFRLQPGNYFGDEALVAETTRNATVTMASDGVLGRLDVATFNRLIKQHLVAPLNSNVDISDKEVTVLDVRFAPEYKQGHSKGSYNIPVSFLRSQLNKMNRETLYVISPANDRRSELATYIMRQAGYRAYQANESLPNAQPSMA